MGTKQVDCLGWWYFGGAPAQSLRNLADGPAATIYQGTPVYNANNIMLGWINSPSSPLNIAALYAGINETLDYTALAVFKSGDSFSNTSGGNNQPIIMSNGSSAGGLTGVNLACSGTPSAAPVCRLTSQIGITTSPNYFSADVTIPDATQWSFVAGRWSTANQTLSTLDVTANVRTDQTTLGKTRAMSATNPKLLLGRRYEGTGGFGFFNLAFFAYYNRALTDAEVATIYASVQSFLAAKRGITC
ncbi:hypothetical protein AZA_35142 [Nitrospirillum viridazoti Y2]|nr:hypothetical protein AZA_35142 [Nitrospirillum amazonense Y2]